MTYAKQMGTPDDSAALAADLRSAVMWLRRRLASERHPDNEVSIPAMAVLAALNRHGEMTLGELAAWERVQPPSMTRTVNCLEKDGHVVRNAHPTDGRIAVVSLSDSGRGVLLADRERRDAWLASRLGDLTSDEREALHRAAPILQRLAQED
ncbi:MarR family transcriptional regulator [Nocardioides jishulii]|uniref:MarR family transcriptional regulator n=2 Tax=Nocardioides jishulii TaxID=2575440 RepID=A0A4U2YWW8_9ACTN|nr:MarR family transcriptional regulator [Nocardioides jishulii]TKI64671.1 MarR family transcriptional regulator [Nocardioides jishulii]